jgi:D-ribose pyranase
MKRTGILNPELAALVAEIGHGDMLVLADAGLRLPPAARVLHLELVAGVPNMADVVHALVRELVVEDAIVASEFEEWNPDVFEQVRVALPVAPRTKPHAELMAEMAGRAKAFVKTGECSAFASVVLVGGVNYFDEATTLRARVQSERAAGTRPPLSRSGGISS